MVNNSSNCMMLEEAFFGDQVIKVEDNTDNKLNFVKRPNSLDLDDLENPAKKKKLDFGKLELTPNDVMKIGMSMSEIERFYCTQQKVLGHTSTPTPSLFPEGVHRLFEELEIMNNKDSNSSFQVERPLTSSESNSSEYLSEPQYAELISSNNFTDMIPLPVIKEERIVPSVTSSPPMSPINMESQEKIKLERKRQRNRVAASKCRKRKLERIAKLEIKVQQLKTDNNELSTVLNQLMDQICTLKQTIVAHTKNGCDFTGNYL